MNQNLDITMFTIPHKGDTITFKYPGYEGKYSTIREQMNSDGVHGPTSSEIVSLVYDIIKTSKVRFLTEQWVSEHYMSEDPHNAKKWYMRF